MFFAFGARAADTRPNIVIFLTDDQGWGDLSVSGNTNIMTPRIDSLARDGLTLDRFFVCQVCAPTRAEFLTGRYYPRTGVSGVSTGQGRLNPDETTLADTFKAAGYATGAFGKWHNGTQPPYHPNDRGFDEYYGFTSGHWGHYFDAPLDHNGQQVRGEGFIIDDFTDKAINFIEANRDGPFLCYLPYNTPHSPFQVPDRFYDKFARAPLSLRHRDPEREEMSKTRAALAMCENIDWNVGRVLDKLDELAIAENTIVIYFSDNGPNSYRWNDGMKGRKGAIDEGGLRVPFFIRWPAQIKPGQKLDHIAGAIDLLPTLTDLAGVPMTSDKPIDGISLKHLLTQDPTQPGYRAALNNWAPRMLFAFKGSGGNTRNAQVSIRTQRFRYDNAGMLYDMTADPGQYRDVSARHPGLTAVLKNAAADHREVMQSLFEEFRGRAFTVGFGPTTTLPARDGVASKGISRSNRAPNNSFYTNWTSTQDNITWDVVIGQGGAYLATVYYTIPEGSIGCSITLGASRQNEISAKVTKAHDPELVGESFDRSPRGGESFIKEFIPLDLGVIELAPGHATLTLGAKNMKGGRLIDVYSVVLTRIEETPEEEAEEDTDKGEGEHEKKKSEHSDREHGGDDTEHDRDGEHKDRD
jgi:arylsulfatase A-like enzyme